jgi:hypothetical protein
MNQWLSFGLLAAAAALPGALWYDLRGSRSWPNSGLALLATIACAAIVGVDLLLIQALDPGCRVEGVFCGVEAWYIVPFFCAYALSALILSCLALARRFRKPPPPNHFNR